MGRGHGGSRGSGPGGGYARSPYYSKDQQSEFLSTTELISPVLSANPAYKDLKGYQGFKDENVRAEVKSAIEQYSKEIGLPEGMRFQLGTLPKGRMAMAQGETVTLSKAYYSGNIESVTKRFAAKQESGFSVQTSRPVARNIHHEIAHRTYDYLPKGRQAAVKALYDRFVSDKSAKGWGSYSKQSATEFYAEGIAKSLGGKSDYYTKELRKLTW